MSHFHRSGHLSWMTLAMAMAALCVASVSIAQQYRTDPIDPSVKAHGAKAKRWVGDPAAYKADKANFTAYFQKYYFPAMTRSTPSDLAELGKMRVDLFKKYLWATTNAELQEHLTDMAYTAAMNILKQAPAYHPAVRYNAVLVLGLLDDEYAIEGGANPRPPKPHTNANKALVQIVKRSDRFSPPIVLGALIGLERHAEYHQSLAPDAVKEMSAVLLKFVNNDKPIQGMDADAYDWLRLRAASALANLGSLGDKNEVHDALITLISTSKSLDDRCAAAGLLGSFKSDKENKYDKVKVDGPATTKALFKLASDLSAAELKRADDFERNPASTYSPSPLSGQGDEAQDDGYPRRHVLARLMNFEAGLSAVKPALPAESQKQVEALLAAITPVIKAAQDEKTISRRITFMIREMSGKITVAVGDLGATDDEGEFAAGEPAPAAAPTAAPSNKPAAPAPGAAQPEPAAAPPANVAPAVEAPPAEAPAAAPPAAQPEGATN